MRRLDSFQETNDTTLTVGPGNTLSQSFYSKYDNLAGVRFRVYNGQLGGKKKYILQIINNSNTLRSETISESNLGWDMEFRYDFAPINQSKNKIYKISISIEDDNLKDADLVTRLNLQKINPIQIDKKTQEILNETQKNYLGVAYAYKNNYKDGTTILNEKSLTGDIVFQSYYQTDIPGFIKGSFAQFSEKVVKDPNFFIFYLIFLVALILTLIRRIRQQTYS